MRCSRYAFLLESIRPRHATRRPYGTVGEHQEKQARRRSPRGCVRAIKVTYRAIFEQPIGALNPMGLKLPGDIPVELFGGPTRWQARPLGRIANAFTRLGTFGSPSEGQSILEQT